MNRTDRNHLIYNEMKMKRNNILSKLLLVTCMSIFMLACKDEEETVVTGAGFATIGTLYYETDGEVMVTIPFINGSVTANNIVFEGGATEGQDYELVGITSEGVQVKLVPDDDCEKVEALRIRIVNSRGMGNKIHTITLISSNLNVGIDIADWVDAYEGDDIIFTSGALAGWSGAADATLAEAGGIYTIDGLGVDFMENIWEEVVLESDPVVLTATPEGVITIEEQYLFTTEYDGDPYDYNIVGTGQINKCDGTITLNYDIVYADHSLSLGDYLKSYQSGRTYFTSVLEPKSEE